jgi:hypothetical protein
MSLVEGYKFIKGIPNLYMRSFRQLHSVRKVHPRHTRKFIRDEQTVCLCCCVSHVKKMGGAQMGMSWFMTRFKSRGAHRCEE